MEGRKVWERQLYFPLASRAYVENRKNFLNLLERDSGATMLDIGCNDGKFTLQCAEKIGASQVWGIDIDEQMIKKARELGIRTKVWDANSPLPLPFENEMFDVVISNQVIEHLYNIDGVLEEIRRVLKTGGYCVVSTTNLASWHNLCLLILGQQPVSYHVSEVQVGNFLRGVRTHGHVKVCTLPALKDLFGYHHLKVEAIRGSGFYPFVGTLSEVLARLLPRYSVYLTVKARKVLE